MILLAAFLSGGMIENILSLILLEMTGKYVKGEVPLAVSWRKEGTEVIHLAVSQNGRMRGKIPSLILQRRVEKEVPLCLVQVMVNTFEFF